MSLPQVLVTGLAASTHFGDGVEPLLASLSNPSSMELRLNGAERRFQPLPPEVGDHPRVRSTHPLTMRLVWTVERALGKFLGSLEEEERERTGASFGHAYGHLDSYFGYFDAATQQGYRVVHPLRFLSTLTNYAAAEINNAYGLWGCSIPVGSGWTAGLEAIGAAVDALNAGDEDTMVAGGFEEINDCTRRVAASGRAPGRGGERQSTFPHPLGEGIGVMLLQTSDAARRKHRTPLASLGRVITRRGLSWADPGAADRAAEAVREALAAADAAPGEVDLVLSAGVAMAAGHPVARRIENQAGVPDAAMRLEVTAATGECFAATGALQCVVAAAALSGAPMSPLPPSGVSDGATPRRPRTALVYSAAGDGGFSAVALSAVAAEPDLPL